MVEKPAVVKEIGPVVTPVQEPPKPVKEVIKPVQPPAAKEPCYNPDCVKVVTAKLPA